MFVARAKLIAAAAIAGLGLTAAAQAAGSATQGPNGTSPTGGPNGAHSRGASVELLAKSSRRFDRSVRIAHRKAERSQRRQAGASGAGAPSGGSFPTPESVGVSMATLNSIAACESGGDPTAVSADGTYRGKYQFDYGTWESVGGSGDPAAASAAEQDYRAALLYSRGGSSPWPICGG